MATVYDFEKHLSCPICLETFKLPKILPCIHTFCKNCLDAHIQKTRNYDSQSFECPMCRIQILPVNKEAPVRKWAQDFPTNHLVNSMLAEGVRPAMEDCNTTREQLVRECMPCSLQGKREQISCFCINCCEYLCEKCYSYHAKFKLLRSHNVLKGSDIPKDNLLFKKMSEIMVCKQHKDNEVELMCSDHKVFVCSTCITGTHRICDVKPITSLPFSKKVFQEYKDVSAALINRVEKVVNSKISELENIHKNEMAAVKIKDSLLSELKCLVQYYESLSTNNMQEEIDCEKAKLSICIAECTGFNDTLSNDFELAEIVSKHGTEQQAIVMVEQLKANEAEIRSQLVQQESERASLPQFCLQAEEAEKLQSVKALLDNLLQHSNPKPSRAENKTLKYGGNYINMGKQDPEQTLAQNGQREDSKGVKNLTVRSLQKSNVLKIGEYNISVERLSRKRCGHIGCVLLDNGNMIFIDNNNYCLKLVSGDFKVLHCYQLDSPPNDVGLVNEDTVVVGKDKEVWLFKILDSYEITRIRSFSTKDFVYSVCGIAGNIGVLYSKLHKYTFGTYIEIRSPTNQILRSINVFKNLEGDSLVLLEPNRIRSHNPEEIIVCEKAQLKAFNLSGDLIWYFNYPGTTIDSIVFDLYKNIYFSESQSIYQIPDSSERYCRCLITNTGFPSPLCIMVDVKKRTLVIGFNDNDLIKVYKFQ